MTPLIINLEGVSKSQWPAERYVLSVVVKAQGESQETVSSSVKTTSNSLQRLFVELSPKTELGLATADAPITTFSMTNLRSSSSVPHDKDGKDLPPQYRANSSFEATFRDFKKLAEVVSNLFTMPYVSIEGTDWRLTDPTKMTAESECRKSALRDAIKKAEDYAGVLGFKVVATEITDHGSTSHGRTLQAARRDSRSRLLSGQLEELSLVAEDVELVNRVGVKFVAE